MILSFGSLFVSCDDTLTLQSIKVTQKPTAEYQYLGESLDTTGMVVTGYYNKGYESVIADYTVSPEKFETIGINTVTVSYKGKTDSFEVNVVRNDLESITIKNPPNKIAYKSGEKLNLTGLVVEGNYKDGTVETITGYTTTPVEGTKLKTTNKKVVISYQDKTTEQSIVVVETPEPTPTPTYKITYNGNGNTDGTVPTAQTGCVYGADVKLAENTGPLALARTDYIFAGWNTAADGTGTNYAAGAEVEKGFTGDTTLYAKWLELKPIGGRVFYMFYDNGLTYTFYDSNGHAFDGTQGYELDLKNTTDSNAIYDKTGNWNKVAYYTVEGTRTDNTADKFYVAEKQSVVQNWSKSDPKGAVRKYDDSNYCVWATGDEDLTSASGIEVLSASSESAIGKGKTNTAWIFSNKVNTTDPSNPVYDPIYFPNGTENNYSCWDFCKSCNDGKINGCNDWFVPSIAECKALRESGIWGSTNADWVTTTKYEANSNSRLWSSSATSNAYYAWNWYVGSSDSNAYFNFRDSQVNYMFLAVVRAF